ncbi:hypothetical protein CMI37_18380 [Candidatus Pacearchaeota archaeon]|nr:hypothetical protein [Candidatus Pacearchaeota archaeon]
MVEKEGKKKDSLKSWKWVLIIAGILVLIYFGWNLFFAYGECDTWVCFNSNLEKCLKTEFIGGEKMIFEYIIRGKRGDICEVDVELLQGDLNNQDSLKLEGYDMECVLPYEAIMIPESDIGNCHGLLKEGLQDLIIRDLHSNIVQNLGRINLEILDPPED